VYNDVLPQIFVIPAKAGIQSFQMLTDGLDSGFHRSDDFLREHQVLQELRLNLSKSQARVYTLERLEPFNRA